MFRTYRQLLTCAILFGLTIACAYAQEITGTISGVVSDETGGVLPSVEVTSRNTGTEATRTAISDDEGRYRLSQLPPGDYEVRAALVGFRTAVLQNISLSVGQQAVIGITLRVGAISEQVVVSAEVALVDTTSGSVANLVDNEQVRNLPLNGRDFIELAALQEGVVTPLSARRTVNGDSGVKMNIAGARSTENAILLDGTDIKNQYGTTPGSVSGKLLGVDTFRELRVITSAYTAEYGRFSGGVISAVTKSGTNEFHGTIFEFFRNSALDARNYFDRDFINPVPRSDPPNFIRNQFGFTVGGPIIKDRTFFFGSYEGLRDRLTTTDISNFPNELAHQGIIPFRFRGVPQCPPSERVGNFCHIDINPQVQPYIDLYPIPQGPDQGDGIAQFFFDNPQPINEDFFVIKIDHQLSENDSLFGRYTFDEAKLDFLTEAFIMGLTETNRNQYVTLEERHIFSPNLLNEIRVAYNRSHSKTDDFPNNGFEVDRDLWFNPLFPAEVGGEYYGGMGLFLCRGCGINQFGTTTRTPQKHTLNNYQLMDNVVWTRGRHSLKLGFSWRALR